MDLLLAKLFWSIFEGLTFFWCMYLYALATLGYSDLQSIKIVWSLHMKTRDTIVSLMGRPLRSSINRDLSYIQSKLSNFNTVQMKNWKELILTRLVINCQSLVQLSSWTAHCALLMLFISIRITDFVDYIDREFVVYIENSRALLFYSERSYSTVRRAAKTTTELRCFPFSRLLIFFTFKNVFSESRLLWGS